MSTAQIESTAFAAIVAHHQLMVDAVEERVAALARCVTGGTPAGAPVADLVAYVGDDVLPHAMAEEKSIYRVAAERPDLAPTVSEMTDEHRRLAEIVDALARYRSGEDALERAVEFEDLFRSHVAKENEVLLPPLLADGDVDLGELLGEMHRLTEGAALHSDSDVPVASGEDIESALFALFLEGVDGLAANGAADPACRLAASAWTVLRDRRPELAGKLTVALHRLARRVDTQPIEIRRKEDVVDSDGTVIFELDVRTMPPARRHEEIFSTYGALIPGATFVLVNDHDPKPLFYQFEAEHAGEFTWDYLENGPEVWRVRIGKAADDSSSDTGEDDEPELDVRAISHARRHDVIFTAYRALRSGAGFTLVNDHDPKPLHYQFEALHPDQFTWDYLESGPRLWRVRIGRAGVGAPQ